MKVEIPNFVKFGIMQSGTFYERDFLVIGADTETQDGAISMIQLCDGSGVSLLQVNPGNALEKFIVELGRLTRKEYCNVCFFHNLSFDLEAMLEPWAKEYCEKGTFEVYISGAKISLFCGKVSFGEIQYSKNKKVYIIDSAKFIRASLEKAAEKLGLKHKKIPRPIGIGVRSPWESDIKEYAENDGWVQYDLGRWIVDSIFVKYSMRPCVSYSQFQQRFFCRDFIPKGSGIPFPPFDCVNISERSYHGGKNGIYIKHPVIIEDCYDLDIISAYAAALYVMPNALNSTYIYSPRYIPHVDGVWEISGISTPSRYPMLFNEGNMTPLVGEFKNVALTSYEVDLALREKKLILHSCRGWFLKPAPDAQTPNPLKKFVDYWFKIKNACSDDDPMYGMAKLGPNAIYGKLIGKIKNNDFDAVEEDGKMKINEFTHRACTLYNPFLASLCTALVRVKLYDMEVQNAGIHSATDAIKCLQRPLENPGVLGGTEIEIHGKCIIFRNKLYLHYDEAGELKKFALHGFWGRPQQLLEMLEKETSNYHCTHMGKLRESRKTNKIPFHVMHDVERSIGVIMKDIKELKSGQIPNFISASN